MNSRSLEEDALADYVISDLRELPISIKQHGGPVHPQQKLRGWISHGHIDDPLTLIPALASMPGLCITRFGCLR